MRLVFGKREPRDDACLASVLGRARARVCVRQLSCQRHIIAELLHIKRTATSDTD